MITSPLYDKEKFEVIAEEVSEEKYLLHLIKAIRPLAQMLKLRFQRIL